MRQTIRLTSKLQEISPHWPLGVLLIASVALGFIVTPDFGQNWDEAGDSVYGRRSIDAYFSPGAFAEHPELPGEMGPAYFMLYTVTSKVFRTLNSEWMPTDGRHFSNFLVFQLSIVAFYSLGLRFLRPGPAFLGTLIFASQPLLLGHAFINQKDIPFMAFFVTSIATGLIAADLSSSKGMPRLPALAWVLVAGGILGFTTSIREAAPLAGAIVSLYFLRAQGRRAIPWLLMYWSTAALVSFATWPLLWGRPLEWFMQRLDVISDFQEHLVLYRGTLESSKNLPWHYLPTLLGIQLNEPAILGVLIGLAVAFVGAVRSRTHRFHFGLGLIWIGIPLIGVSAFGVPIYGNMRHMLFVVPGLMLLAAAGWGAVYESLRPSWQKALLATALLAPSMIHMAQSHPYEYVYYNQLVGGVRGADGAYELDHWCTSYREAMGFANATAAEGARIAVWGPIEAASTFARKDLTIVPSDETGAPPELALACKRVIDNPSYFPSMVTVYQISRYGAILGEVKAVPGSLASQASAARRPVSTWQP